jgi:hypothetical protein
MILLIEYFRSPNPERFQEIINSIKTNVEIKDITKIYAFVTENFSELEVFKPKLQQVIIPGRLTFYCALKFAQDLNSLEPIALSNNDITFEAFHFILLVIALINSRNMVTLTRYNKIDDEWIIDSKDSQDCFIFTKITDGLLTERHHHESAFRTYDRYDLVKGEYHIPEFELLISYDQYGQLKRYESLDP